MTSLDHEPRVRNLELVKHDLSPPTNTALSTKAVPEPCLAMRDSIREDMFTNNYVGRASQERCDLIVHSTRID